MAMHYRNYRKLLKKLEPIVIANRSQSFKTTCKTTHLETLLDNTERLQKRPWPRISKANIILEYHYIIYLSIFIPSFTISSIIKTHNY